MIQQFTMKPVVVEAVQFNGNTAEIDLFIGGEGVMTRIADDNCVIVAVGIVTKEGTIRADKGDWIIKAKRGEFYVCTPDAFEIMYNLVT